MGPPTPWYGGAARPNPSRKPPGRGAGGPLRTFCGWVCSVQRNRVGGEAGERVSVWQWGAGGGVGKERHGNQQAAGSYHHDHDKASTQVCNHIPFTPNQQPYHTPAYLRPDARRESPLQRWATHNNQRANEPKRESQRHHTAGGTPAPHGSAPQYRTATATTYRAGHIWADHARCPSLSAAARATRLECVLMWRDKCFACWCVWLLAARFAACLARLSPCSRSALCRCALRVSGRWHWCLVPLLRSSPSAVR